MFHRSLPLSKTLLILGKPGGGKGTISKKIIKSFPTTVHLSTGDILRDNVRAGTEIGLKAKSFMDSGALVPDDVVIALVSARLKADASKLAGGHTLLDGFPRTVSQATALEKSGVKVDHVLNLDVPTQTIVDRISDRWISPSTGTVYSYSYQPPKVRGKDDATGEALVQRDDDKPAAVTKRLEAFDKMNGPLLEFYDTRKVLVSFAGTESDVIFKKVEPFLNKALGKK